MVSSARPPRSGARAPGQSAAIASVERARSSVARDRHHSIASNESTIPKPAMLIAKVKPGEISYYATWAEVPVAAPSPILYRSSRWLELPSDLLCGIARNFDDPGFCFVLPGAPEAVAESISEGSDQNWIRVGSIAVGQLCYYAIGETDLALFPNYREGVEQAMDEIIASNQRFAFAFEGYNRLRLRLSAISDADALELAWQLHESRLFSLTCSFGCTRIFPGSITTAVIQDLHEAILNKLNMKMDEY